MENGRSIKSTVESGRAFYKKETGIFYCVSIMFLLSVRVFKCRPLPTSCVATLGKIKDNNWVMTSYKLYKNAKKPQFSTTKPAQPILSNLTKMFVIYENSAFNHFPYQARPNSMVQKKLPPFSIMSALHHFPYPRFDQSKLPRRTFEYGMKEGRNPSSYSISI